MSMPLSKLIDNLSEGIHNNKCADCKFCLHYVRSTKNEKLILKCLVVKLIIEKNLIKN